MREGLTGERVLCRVYLRSTDLVHGQTAAGWIVGHARKAGLAGATVLEGMYGYGSRGVVAPRLWHMSVERPVIVEVVEEGERIVEFLEEGVLPWLRHGMVTLERAAVLLYRDREGEGVELKGAGSVKDLSTVPTCAGRLPMVRDGVLLRIFAGESDEVGGRPLYEAVVSKARELGMSGRRCCGGRWDTGSTRWCTRRSCWSSRGRCRW